VQCFGIFVLVLDKDRELGEAQVEIKALRLSERAREKAVEEVITECATDLCISVFCSILHDHFTLFRAWTSVGAREIDTQFWTCR
jgi:hypothetical protein